MNFEDELRSALRREQPPPDFAAKVMAKTRVLPFWRRPATLAMAAALAVAALVPSAVYQYRQEQRAIEARDQLIEALAIAKVQLLQVGEKIRRTRGSNK